MIPSLEAQIINYLYYHSFVTVPQLILYFPNYTEIQIRQALLNLEHNGLLSCQEDDVTNFCLG